MLAVRDNNDSYRVFVMKRGSFALYSNKSECVRGAQWLDFRVYADLSESSDPDLLHPARHHDGVADDGDAPCPVQSSGYVLAGLDRTVGKDRYAAGIAVGGLG